MHLIFVLFDEYEKFLATKISRIAVVFVHTVQHVQQHPGDKQPKYKNFMWSMILKLASLSCWLCSVASDCVACQCTVRWSHVCFSTMEKGIQQWSKVLFYLDSDAMSTSYKVMWINTNYKEMWVNLNTCFWSCYAVEELDQSRTEKVLWPGEGRQRKPQTSLS